MVKLFSLGIVNYVFILKSATPDGKEILPVKEGIYGSRRSQKQAVESFMTQNPLTP